MVEFEPDWERPSRNREEFARVLPSAADVAVFPELTFSGFTMRPEPDAEAEPFLREQAARARTAIIAGHVAAGPRNRAIAVDREGCVLARYDKLHPFTFAGEDKHYEAGGTLPVFELGGLRAAMLICYDLRFPEPFREAALRGAEAFFVLANWPAARVHHWRALLVARAIENQTFVFGVNRVGRDPHETYVTSSLAIGPDGTILRDGAGLVDADPAAVREQRRRFPFLRDVRRDRYAYPV